ncbi:MULTISPECIES: GntR family transcriptional regulator [Arthrobacter]|uniref:GntR family transcriptional regulator n=1 Tax=Arthrobacter terricola TaxID=2547396 RepID=A0A4R5KIJ3_9MICC|nr:MULTISPECIES: GntR family transcriptional regulator [Arthrobacter]MBT8161865.1 GntR family transcriptional regulator [Arthrobacter sp. GN70]TDF94247.1 GntR family transcriptional regulator [Arthrobacter terricola]
MLTAEDTNNADRPLRESVRDTLRSRIFEGHYAPGTRLVERDLAAEFNVSRLPIREALRMLRQEGLIQERASRGSEVAGLSPKDVEDLFDVRQSLEVLACRLAATRATNEDLEHLAGLLEEAERCLAKGSILEAHRANSEFHDAITAIANNDFLRSALEPLQGRMHWLFRHVSDLPELIQEHRELYAAIASGDPGRAATQSASHIGKYREQFPENPPAAQPKSQTRPKLQDRLKLQGK